MVALARIDEAGRVVQTVRVIDPVQFMTAAGGEWVIAPGEKHTAARYDRSTGGWIND